MQAGNRIAFRNRDGHASYRKSHMSLKRRAVLLLAVLAFPVFAGDVTTKKRPVTGSRTAESARSGVLWLDPADISSRDLFYGSGGEKRAPHGSSFTFEKEDREGSNPKLDVRDEDNVKWKLKLGSEARPETAATRFVWAAGYFTQDDYLVSNIHVDELPANLHRGEQFIGPQGSIEIARVKRNPEGYEKAGEWKWKHIPFENTREWNGLRVMMALINNWDLKDQNNQILDLKKAHDDDRPERIYLISDLGSSFGTTSLGRHHLERKGNLDFYRQSKFIARARPDTVDFAVPGKPAFIVLVNPHEYFSRVHLEWIGRNIPRADARWMGELLGRLSPGQIRDAFRAGGFSPDEVEGFAKVIETRIAALKNL